jgi:alpha-amylase
MQGFEWYGPTGGVHWNNLKDRVSELSDMGVTALWLREFNGLFPLPQNLALTVTVWLAPPCKAAGQDSIGYDIYDVRVGSLNDLCISTQQSLRSGI